MDKELLSGFKEAKKIFVKITLAKSAGFCSGVKRAITTALKATGTKSRIAMLGDIVHNEDVVRQIQMSGIKKISRCRGRKHACRY